VGHADKIGCGGHRIGHRIWPRLPHHRALKGSGNFRLPFLFLHFRAIAKDRSYPAAFRLSRASEEGPEETEVGFAFINTSLYSSLSLYRTKHV